MPTLAIVTCIRNEARFLPAFLAYHRALGVDRAYMYLDRCSDESQSILSNHSWVQTFNRDLPENITQVSLHQMGCVNDAMKRARSDGIDWLMMIDADEFAWGGAQLPAGKPWHMSRNRYANQLLKQGSLKQLVSSVSEKTEMIVMPAAEIVVEQGTRKEPFWKLDLFQISGCIKRPVLNPADGTTQELNRWIGHRVGKSLVRTSLDVQAFDSHTWTRNQQKEIPDDLPISSETRGTLLHYAVTSAEHWWNKYRRVTREPPHWIRGEKVDFPRQAWKETAARIGIDEARKYFDEWVAAPGHIIQDALRSGNTVRITLVNDILTTIHNGKLQT